MRIAVCDDEEPSLLQAEKLLLELSPEFFGETVVHSYMDNSRMLLCHEKEPYDIVVMDIQMEPLDGFAAAERLSEMGWECKLIFLSSREELVFQSFRYEPVYFVRKGLPEQMREELRRALRRIQEKYDKRIYFYFPDKEGMLERVPAADIEYIESSRNYLLYFSSDGKKYRLRKTMEEEEKSLERYGFLRIHRAYLVNRRLVMQIRQNASELRMKSGKVLEVGKSYRRTAAEYFMEKER